MELQPQIVKPRLTLISQPMREIAVNAAILMLEHLESERLSRTKIIELNSNLMKGQSALKL